MYDSSIRYAHLSFTDSAYTEGETAHSLTGENDADFPLAAARVRFRRSGVRNLVRPLTFETELAQQDP